MKGFERAYKCELYSRMEREAFGLEVIVLNSMSVSRAMNMANQEILGSSANHSAGPASCTTDLLQQP